MYCFRNLDINESKVHLFYRLLKDGLLIDSAFYNRKRKTKSSVVKYFLDGISYVGAVEVCLRFAIVYVKRSVISAMKTFVKVMRLLIYIIFVNLLIAN